MRTVVVRRGRAKPLWAGHPWVHADSVLSVRAPEGEVESAPEDADFVRVEDEDGKPIGCGFLSPGSAIRVRLVLHAAGGTLPEADPDALLRARVDEAVALRRRLFPSPDRTDAYRLVHAEGDGLPGLVVDRWGDVLVAQFSTAAVHRRRLALAEALLRSSGARSLVTRSGGYEAEEGIPAGEVEFLSGDPAPESLDVREEGMWLRVEPRGGQKTGHYADQRENRLHVAAVAAGATVLDLYAGTGGFSLQALRQGAASALAVESSGRSAAAAIANAARNGVGDRLEVRESDVRHVLQDLRDARRTFDVVVADPPNFFPRRGGGGLAVKAYRELNVRALTRVTNGGFLATFSCSSSLDTASLLEIARSAARECRRSVALLREMSAGPDHPVAMQEGRYLTGLLLRVLDL